MPCIKLKIVFEHVSTAINTLPEYYRPKILLFTRLRLENRIIDFFTLSRKQVCWVYYFANASESNLRINKNHLG